VTLEFDAAAKFVLPAGQTEIFTNETGLKVSIPIFPSPAAIAITIAGELRVVASSADAPPAHEIAAISSRFTGVFAQSKIDVTSTGSLHVDTTASGDSAAGYDGDGFPVTIEGLVDVRSGTGDATGLLVGSSSYGRLAGDPALMINSGQIRVVSAGGAAMGVNAADGSFLNVGSIEVTSRVGACGVATSNTFENTGSIVAHDPSGAGLGTAVLFIIERDHARFLNAGLLQGDTALLATDNPPNGAVPRATIQNTGQMIGAVDLRAGDQTLLNEGTIVGAVSMGDGDDIYDGRAGTVSGRVSGGDGNDTLIGGAGADSLQGDAGSDSLSGGAGDDRITGGHGDDSLDGGGGRDVAVYSGARSDYTVTPTATGYAVVDGRPGSPDGSDMLRNIEGVGFSDQTMALSGAPVLDPTVTLEISRVLRGETNAAAPTSLAATLSAGLAAGSLSQSDALQQILLAAQNTSSVATLSYEFFTGKAPSAGGMDFLVSPTGPNPNNLNAAYYQSFSLENRYINFAVNLGKVGEGNTAFTAKYGGLSLFEATRMAYATIFGDAPSDAKLHAILDPTTVLNGQTFSRSDYFAYYGQDGATGIGTKAAMVGYLLAEAEKADLGVYAKSNDAFLTDVALHNASFGLDLVGVYNQPGFVFHPG
jgi:Ca2+-binding RTX toxin-like protein